MCLNSPASSWPLGVEEDLLTKVKKKRRKTGSQALKVVKENVQSKPLLLSHLKALFILIFFVR